MNSETDIKNIDNMFFRENEGRVYKSLLECFEKQLFEKLLSFTCGNQLQAAKILGINRNTLRAKLKKLGIWR